MLYDMSNEVGLGGAKWISKAFLNHTSLDFLHWKETQLSFPFSPQIHFFGENTIPSGYSYLAIRLPEEKREERENQDTSSPHIEQTCTVLSNTYKYCVLRK
ncbi:unnamed protein product [Orchesella dallaii]|uniref:Uncharacterized protein n=1 Tax=Orchesella dallaii TaxID=48710 RepID=A0ABP1PUG6_9HEXA